MHNVSREGRIAFGWATAGVVFAVAFTVWALVAPVYSSGATLLDGNEEPLLRAVVATPLTVAVVTWLLLHIACRRNVAALRTLGLVLAGLLCGLAMLGAMTVGLLIAPAALALLAGALFTPVHGHTL
jgi:hypothetical protein